MRQLRFLLVLYNILTPVWSFVVHRDIMMRRTVWHRSSHIQRFFSNNDSNNNNENNTVKTNNDIWAQQKALLQEMSTAVNERQTEFAKRRQILLNDTAYIGFFLFCGLWIVFDNPFVALSYSLGTILGLAYVYGLGKYVESLGGNSLEEDSVRGAGVGQARFAFLILLFVFVGKFRSTGLVEVPTILGFFTYQLASLNQGLREVDD